MKIISLSQSKNSLKPDKSKINKALSSFWNNFDENNIPKANKELSDLIQVAMFSSREKAIFVDKIQKELSAKGITLDAIFSV